MISSFISYSHDDDVFRNELQRHLEVLRREGVIDIWHDRRMQAGQEFEAEIDARLNEAHIIVLLVSSHFLASRYCYEVEFERAFERHKEGSARIIPVILTECDWKHTPIAKLNVLPRDGKPVTKYPDRNDAYLEVVQAIRTIVSDMRADDVLNLPQKKTTATTRPVLRSSNLRVKKNFNDHDRDQFLNDSFDYIAKLFEGSLAELEERNQEISTSFRMVDNNRFNATIYRNGQKVSSCQIRLEAGTSINGLSSGIAYSINGQANSYNDLLVVDEGDQSLHLNSNFGMFGLGGRTTSKQLTPQGGAEHYWARLMEPLQR